ncbi:MAG: hypothetical protein D3910_08555 [Candidatus Electrothrix sp. ATG2]|nr:hypothetical protein [Candidatus Electrothrix sp. ATG2]
MGVYMKFRLTITIIGLLLTGMLLVNFVVLFLWKHDALQREVKHDQAVMEHIQSLLSRARASNEISGSKEFLFSDFYDTTEKGRFFLLLHEEQAGRDEKKNPGQHDAISELLASAAAEAMKSGKPVSRTTTVLPGVLSCNDLLLNALPVLDQGEVIGAIAVIRSLDALFQTFWKIEQTVLVYLIINVIVLSAIGFFRMAGLVIRPVDRLVALANQYNNHSPFQFVSEGSGSEFAKLSNSLNSMLLRIEEDRQTLQQTVAALKTANQTLKKQQQKVVAAEKLASVGRMAAGLAHEIGNPLSVVQGYLGMLLSSQGLSREHKDFLQRSEQEVQRINTLIRQLLDFSRTGKGRPKIFSLHELLFSVVEMVKVQTGFRGITLDCALAAEKDRVYADAEHLRQVLVNCLLNSADAIHMIERDRGQRAEGRVSVVTELQVDLSGAGTAEERVQLLIRIIDNGIGIAEEHLPLVFDPFYTSKEPGKGTGLGLSVSRSLVEAAGGTMELKSKIGQGSRMLITLPLADCTQQVIPSGA